MILYATAHVGPFWPFVRVLNAEHLAYSEANPACKILTMTEAPESELQTIAQLAYDESIPNFVKYLKDLFHENPRGQSEVRVKVDSNLWLRSAFISDFVTEPPWHPDRYIDGETGRRDVDACVRVGEMTVQVDALSWDHFVLATANAPPNLGPWFDKWFYSPRPLNVDGLRLSGCIHSVTTDRFRGYYVTRIDLGTAKPKAFMDLIETCQRARIPKVVIGSSYAADLSAH